MIVKYEKTNNPHLYILKEDFITLVQKIINSFTKKQKIKVLNIGGGYKKQIETYFLNNSKVDYYCLDIDTSNLEDGNVIVGDITEENLQITEKFDFIFTKDTFEHILNPWDATKNIRKLLSEDGYFLCIVPFAWRYHACPLDSYRYTHTGLRYIFERQGEIKPIFSGYRRISAQTSGQWASKTDYTLNGKPFSETIETVYLAQKDSNHLFNLEQLDIDKERH